VHSENKAWRTSVGEKYKKNSIVKTQVSGGQQNAMDLDSFPYSIQEAAFYPFVERIIDGSPRSIVQLVLKFVRGTVSSGAICFKRTQFITCPLFGVEGECLVVCLTGPTIESIVPYWIALKDCGV